MQERNHEKCVDFSFMTQSETETDKIFLEQIIAIILFANKLLFAKLSWVSIFMNAAQKSICAKDKCLVHDFGEKSG